ncbi:serine/threonine-protein kinase MPS1 isoform X1 [Brassica napus]|uniref:serine/threonine-protein kinase MPS1 isoform X1 n=1 Tax=Brassica oleracea var. oleracea TaxID=109376 RepID=UPI0006A747EE|nr:PREDICTED: serine/threonine-protein kinase MPS1 isoform X1 [Brassica oleracea var. oleracea]XP_013664478.1 serine/threonine-protein kinase MPS1 isoform X1 [Brassica napus]
MEKEEANLQRDKPPKSLARPILNHETSSSSSSPELIRHLQAAFKRHRPLNKMQTTTIGPRRSVAAQRQPSRSSTADGQRPQDVVSLSQSLAANTLLTQDSRNLPSSSAAAAAGESTENASVSGTVDNMLGGNFNQQDRQMDLPKPLKSNLDIGSRNESVSTKVQSLVSSSTLTSNVILADMEWDATNQAEASKHQNLHPVDSEISLKSEYKVSSSLAKLGEFRNFLNQPASQCSVMGSSCATTTSIHSSSAPMLNATTQVSRYPSAVPIPSQGNLASSRPSFKDSNVLHANKDGPLPEMPASAIDQEVRVQEPNMSKQQQCTTVVEPPTLSRGSDATARVPDDMLTSVSSQPQKPDKLEKVASSKGTSAPRKRNYDPDLFFKVNGKLYQRLGKIGSGGSSEVHKVISSDCTIYALKKIKLKGRDYATAYGFCQEIGYLKKLKGKTNIIQLIDYEVTDKALLQEVLNGTMSNKDARVKDDGFIYMVLEYGEIDLAHMLSQKWKEIEGSDRTIDENWLRFYWQQILQAVNTIHEERIVHSDLKPANFLLVRGFLKLIDFGIAKAINSDTTNIQRDSQVGTLSYMSPEAFMCNESDENGNIIKCGRPSDIWSLGCILYQMVYGRTPFADYKTFWAKFKVITDPNHEITYTQLSNPWLVDLMKKCLAWDRNQRWRIPELLQHPFLAPPIPPEPRVGSSSIQLLSHIAECFGSDDRVSELCAQLKDRLRVLGGE